MQRYGDISKVRGVKELNELVFIEDGQAVTDSLTVAEVFGKRHDAVLRDIRNQMEYAGEVFAAHNFVDGTYKDKNNQSRPKINLSEDAFALVAMSYNTKEAVQMKVKFIQEFKRIKEKLAQPKSLSEHEQRVELLKLSLDHEEKLLEYDERISSLEENVRIDSFQQNVIQKQIKVRVYKVFENHNPQKLELNKLFPNIHRNFRDAFGIPTYRDLRKLDFEDAVSWIHSWRPLI